MMSGWFVLPKLWKIYYNVSLKYVMFMGIITLSRNARRRALCTSCRGHIRHIGDIVRAILMGVMSCQSLKAFNKLRLGLGFVSLQCSLRRLVEFISNVVWV